MKLPRTQHIEGSRMPPGQTDPEAVPFSELAGRKLVIEEKIDGTGVSLGFEDSLNLFVHHRGSPATGKEFTKLHQWAERHLDILYDNLGDRYVMFGEWMYKKHTVFYDDLPSFFLESDIYDKEKDVWLSTERRHRMFERTTIQHVQVIKEVEPKQLSDITELVGVSWYKFNWKEHLRRYCHRNKLNLEQVMSGTEDSDLMEGLYIKDETPGYVVGRYKYVRYDFLKKILDSGTHVQNREIIPNELTEP